MPTEYAGVAGKGELLEPRKTMGLGARAGTSGSKMAGARVWPGVVVREPFFHFIVLGLLIWAGVEYWNADNNRYTIDMGAAERDHLAAGYLRQFGRLPTARELDGIVDRYVREEIFVREGKAMGLDTNDEIVRRRIFQKYEFLQTDLAVPDSPAAGVLERWFEENRQAYLASERVAFRQIYFSTDRDGEACSRARAVNALKVLNGTGPTNGAELGDLFPGPSHQEALTPEVAGRVFGRSEMAAEVFKAPSGAWAGPYRSGYGWHLVHVTKQVPAALPPLSDIREQVLADYLAEQRRIINARNFKKVRAKYVIHDDGTR